MIKLTKLGQTIVDFIKKRYSKTYNKIREIIENLTEEEWNEIAGVIKSENIKNP
jgi:hypothetical protein